MRSGVDSLEESQLPRRTEVEALQEEKDSTDDWDSDGDPCDGTDGDANTREYTEELCMYTRMRPNMTSKADCYQRSAHLPNSVTIRAIGNCQSHNRMSWLNLRELNRSAHNVSVWVELLPVKNCRHTY